MARKKTPNQLPSTSLEKLIDDHRKLAKAAEENLRQARQSLARAEKDLKSTRQKREIIRAQVGEQKRYQKELDALAAEIVEGNLYDRLLVILDSLESKKLPATCSGCDHQRECPFFTIKPHAINQSALCPRQGHYYDSITVQTSAGRLRIPENPINWQMRLNAFIAPAGSGAKLSDSLVDFRPLPQMADENNDHSMN